MKWNQQENEGIYPDYRGSLPRNTNEYKCTRIRRKHVIQGHVQLNSDTKGEKFHVLNV